MTTTELIDMNELMTISKSFEDKVTKSIQKSEENKKIYDELVRLRSQLGRLQYESLPAKYKIVNRLPSFLKRSIGIDDAYIAYLKETYPSVKAIIQEIDSSLDSAKQSILQDNQELQELIEKIKQYKEKVQLAIKEVEDRDDLDEFEKNQLLLDLQVLESSLDQSETSIIQVINTNIQLVNVIHRTAKTVKVVAYVGVITRYALHTQKQVIDVVNNMKQFASQLVTSNSEVLLEQTKQIKELNSKPVIEIDAIKKAYENIGKAIEEYESFKTEGLKLLQNSLAYINKVKFITENMKKLPGKLSDLE